MASTVHQTWGNFFSRRIGCLPARPLASALRRLALLYREILLLRQIPSCFPAGPRFTLDSPVLPEHRCFYLSFPSVLEVFPFPGQGIPDKPPNVLPDVRIPEWEERRLPRQCNSQKKGCLLLTRIRAPAAHSTRWCGVREPWAEAVTQIYKVCISG